MTTAKTPIHQWTDGGDRVLILKWVEDDLTSYGGFKWPEQGPVRPTKCGTDTNCESGGLFGWPWGLHLGDGKRVDFNKKWIVFSADPSQVIDCGGKVKVAAENPEDVDCVVEYCGTYQGALMRVLASQSRWITYFAEGAATASGDYGAATASGAHGAATASGYSGAATASGAHGAATASGGRGAATAAGAHGAATASGDYGAATASGIHGAATASGTRGAATTSGIHGAATASGTRGAATASGAHGAAVITGEYSTLTVSECATGLATCKRFYWNQRKGAIVFHRWQGGYRVLVSDNDDLTVKVDCGEIVDEWGSN